MGNGRIRPRGDTAANWTSADPTLAERELAIETDTAKLKVGDGSTAWSSLGYVSAAASLSNLTFNSSGGAAAGTVYDGSVARTVDYSTVGAQPLDATLTALAALAWTSGTQVPVLTAADTFSLKTVGTSAGNLLDKASGDALYSGIAHQTSAITSSGHTMTTARLLGRTTASTGAIEELTATAAKSFLAIAAADVSGLGYFATGTDAANLTGTVAAARLPAFSGGDVTSSAGSANLALNSNQKVRSISFVIDGGGAAITTGQKGHLEIPFACTITGWTILADQSGSIVVDVWKDTYANFPPTVADTIAGTEKPTLSSVQKNQDLSLSSWTTNVAAGDILAFNVDSASNVQRVVVALRVTVT